MHFTGHSGDINIQHGLICKIVFIFFRSLQSHRDFCILYRNKKVRQQPTFPTNVSIIGVRELDFRVRDGNGYCLSTMATGQFIINYPLHTLCKRLSTGTKGMFCNKTNRYAQKFLSGINNMVKPHDLLVPLGYVRRRTCTCGLSTG